MNEIAFRRRLQQHKNGGYLLSIPRAIAESFQTDEIEIIISEGGIKLQPVHYQVRGANV
jgi:hypothetical protein